MWVLENSTVFSAERTWITDAKGVRVWLVAVKGTFKVRADGSVRVADVQEEMYRVPVYRGDPNRSSLLYESDMTPPKQATDVILHGNAHVPEGRPIHEVEVTLKVGPIEKTLTVVGDRTWERNGEDMGPTDPAPFTKMPIVYERAFGGVDRTSENPEEHGWEPQNPVGAGFAVEPERLLGQRLPNILRGRQSAWGDSKDPPGVAGFGPIAPHWSPRRESAGTYDEDWRKSRLPLPPSDFSDLSYQCAPEDQQVAGYLRGGERVELYNLIPAGLLTFTLPEVSLTFHTAFYGRRDVDHSATLQTVILEPDAERLMMVWTSALPFHYYSMDLKKTEIYGG
jgi:hypothetical protein